MATPTRKPRRSRSRNNAPSERPDCVWPEPSPLTQWWQHVMEVAGRTGHRSQALPPPTETCRNASQDGFAGKVLNL